MFHERLNLIHEIFNETTLIQKHFTNNINNYSIPMPSKLGMLCF